MNSIRSHLSTLVKLLLTAGLLYWVFSKQKFDPQKAIDSWAHAHWGWIALALVFNTLNLVIITVRWDLLLKAQGIQLGGKNVAGISLIGAFFNVASIGVVGADSARLIYSLRVHPQNKTGIVLSIFIDRLIGVLAMCILAFMVLPLSWPILTSKPETAAFVWFILAFLAAVVFGTLGCFILESPGWWQRYLGWKNHLPLKAVREKFGQAVLLYAAAWRSCLACLAISVPVHVFSLLGAICVVQALSIQVPLKLVCGIIPMVNVATAIPLTISGFGVREYLLTELLNLAHVDQQLSLLFSLTIWATFTLPHAFFGGLSFILYRGAPSTENLSTSERTP